MKTLFIFFFFFFNDTATTEIYTLSLHDALPISPVVQTLPKLVVEEGVTVLVIGAMPEEHLRTPVGVVVTSVDERSEEHTSELQSLAYLVCRLLLEKKKKSKEK